MSNSKYDWIKPEDAFKGKLKFEMHVKSYVEIQEWRGRPSTVVFQDLFMHFYQVRNRSEEWQKAFFGWFDQINSFDDKEFRKVLIALSMIVNDGGRFVDTSFVSKMFATMNPAKSPIWDSCIAELLRSKRLLRVTEKRSPCDDDPGGRIAPAVENYKRLLAFYDEFKTDDKYGDCISAFNKHCGEFEDDVEDLKKVDFVLWTLGKQWRRDKELAKKKAGT